MTQYTKHTRMGPMLTLLWLFAVLNILFRDIHEMVEADTINDILAGHMNGAPVTEGALLAGAFAVELILLALLLSSVLTPLRARRFNLLAAPLAMAGSLYVPPGDPDDVVFAIVVMATFLAIFVLAWRWQVDGEPFARGGARHVA